MQLSEFTFKIMFLFFPGIITFSIINFLTLHKEHKAHHWIIYSYVFGIINYSIFVLVVGFFRGYNVLFYDSLWDKTIMPPISEIFWTTFIGIILGVIISKLSISKICEKLLQKLNNQYLSLDLCHHILKIDETFLPKFVVIRDYNNHLIYEGYVKACSDPTEEKLALFLSDVQVYLQNSTFNDNPTNYENADAVPLYFVQSMYLPINQDTMVIEFPESKIYNDTRYQ